jgi:hypothetical protein
VAKITVDKIRITIGKKTLELTPNELKELRDINENTYLAARVAQLEHEAGCYACEICSPGEWTQGQCEECKRLHEAVKAAKESA